MSLALLRTLIHVHCPVSVIWSGKPTGMKRVVRLSTCVCRVERLRECNVIRSAHQSTERNAIPKNVNQLITCCVYTIPWRRKEKGLPRGEGCLWLISWHFPEAIYRLAIELCCGCALGGWRRHSDRALLKINWPVVSSFSQLVTQSRVCY